MRTAALEYELEALPEFEGEYELEGEYESEEFFRQLAALARRAVQSPTMQRVARRARQAALVGRMAGLALHPLQQPALPPPRPVPAEVRRDTIAAGPPESEWEWEMESELNPIRRVYPDALMEHLGHAAAEAESEAEAEAFIGALIPLAARLVPRIAPAVMRAAPNLIRGATRVARTLRANPTTRPLVRTIPTIVRRTAVQMARQAARGQPVTPTSAVQTLARQAGQVIGSPQQSVQAWRRSCALDRHYHRAGGGTTPGSGVRQR